MTEVTELTCVVKAVDPPVPGGLLIEGRATTRGWGTYEAPLARGLVTLDGRTTYWTRGLDPRDMVSEPPIPLLWHHNESRRIGVLFRTYATRDELFFNACVVPPGTLGYDADLLKQVWGDLRTGRADAVSTSGTGERHQGKPWRLEELSVVPRGEGANPFALISRACFPDGYERVVDTPRPDERVTRIVSAKHYAHRELKHAHPPPMRYRGPWREGVTYQPGHCVTRSGLLWHCNAASTSKPGTDDTFTMMFKDKEKR